MNIVICNGRLTGRLALTLALLVSNSTQIVLLGESNRAAVALAAQNRPRQIQMIVVLRKETAK